MDIRAADIALRRAMKAARHAQEQLASAASPRAMQRHKRRLHNAMRATGDARHMVEALTFTDA